MPQSDVRATSHKGPDCGLIILPVSSRGVIQTLVWHQYYYSCSFRSRSHSDTRLAPVLLFLQFPLEESFRPSFGTQYLFWDFGRTTARLLCDYPHALLISMSERTCYSAHMLHVYICYILCPNCLASTFIVLTWLVDLARC